AESDDGSPAASSQPSLSSSPTGAPALDVEVVTDGLDHPWDVAQAPDGTLLLDERPGGFTAVLTDGTVQEVEADLDDLFARGRPARWVWSSIPRSRATGASTAARASRT